MRTVEQAQDSHIVPRDGHSLDNIFPFCPDVGIAVGEAPVVVSTLARFTARGDNLEVLNMLAPVVLARIPS